MPRPIGSLFPAAILALAGCAPGAVDDTGAADLTLTAAGGEPLQLIHAPGLSEVRVTPPVDGEVELRFTYNDPLVDVTLRTNANEVSEGEVVALPSEALSLTVVMDDAEYTSTDASGDVELQVLDVDDASGAATVSALLDATLRSDAADELVVEGFLEGSVEGDAP